MDVWKKLTPASKLAHRLDDEGRLLLRGADAEAAPFVTARVRDGQGGFVERSITSLGFAWTRTGDGWMLRTSGAPKTAATVAKLWSHLTREACAPHGIDPQIVLTTIACEARAARPDASGQVRAPRTEKGYPQRTGERDPGDFTRDAADWQASRGAHSSHGLMQTLIATATAVRPDLFKGVNPSEYRTVLWSPANSIACGVAYIARFPATVLADPFALRIHYASGSVRIPQKTPNRWGAVVFDELVPMHWLAFWNDAAALRLNAIEPAPAATSESPEVTRPDHTIAWTFATFALFALSIAAAWAASHLTQRATVPGASGVAR